MTCLLIANRGEIACRITQTAQRMGFRVAAVYSAADVRALHVEMADEAFLIGEAPAAQSYLDVERLIGAAKQAGADMVHPGYGFLSENVEFAKACEDNGIRFVGPPVAAIDAMGRKDAAKELMLGAGVPVVPGYLGEDQSPARLQSEADKIGYPVLIKAVAGGGGKGMRRVDTAADFASALAACRREAKAAFGDDHVLIEKFVTAPRHIEVQVFCDTHGNAVHLFERDCSMQRRHQKVIEEAPAPGVGEEARDVICQAAIAAAKAVGYVGAGTVEFIADTAKGIRADAVYFMEMNTRLQVEHPVTEAITGVDLVEWQLRVAAGETLPCTQDELAINGHAIEARIYAEDPSNGFLPQTGRLHHVAWPQALEGVRVDTGVRSGDAVTPFYDPMLAKVICHAEGRAQAIALLQRSLSHTALLGLKSNAEFCSRLVGSAEFSAATHNTGTIDANINDLSEEALTPVNCALAFEAWLHALRGDTPETGPWQALGGWSLSGTPRRDRIALELNGTPVVGLVTWHDGDRVFAFETDGDSFEVSTSETHVAGNLITTRIDGARHDAQMHVCVGGSPVYLGIDGAHVAIAPVDTLARGSAMTDTGGTIRAPMSGRIIELAVSAGDTVARGQTLAVLEAMKMEHPLTAGFDAKVEEVRAQAGDQVDDGAAIVILAPADGNTD